MEVDDPVAAGVGGLILGSDTIPSESASLFAFTIEGDGIGRARDACISVLVVETRVSGGRGGTFEPGSE